MSNVINLVRGTTKNLVIDLLDQFNQRISSHVLKGASATFLLRVLPTDSSNVLMFTTTANPVSLSIDLYSSTLNLLFQTADTATIPLGLYNYQLQLTLADLTVQDVVPWTLFDLNLGGTAPAPTPPFTNTAKITADYPLPGDMKYVTPGGSPIENAQVRVYLKSDYDAGNLTTPVGITTTNCHGNWVNPVFVLPGFTYTVQFLKPSSFGPDVVSFFV